MQLNETTTTGRIEIAPSQEPLTVAETATAKPQASYLDELTISQADSLSAENQVNSRRVHQLKRSFTGELKRRLLEEGFEYGIESGAEQLVKKSLNQNALATKSWLSSVFMESYASPRADLACGILRVIARMDETLMDAEGQTIALTALTHKDPLVQECGIRVFESWGSPQSLRILEQVKVTPDWLQDYVSSVISDLTEQLRCHSS